MLRNMSWWAILAAILLFGGALGSVIFGIQEDWHLVASSGILVLAGIGVVLLSWRE